MPALKASYTSPSTSQTFTHPLTAPLPNPNSTTAATAVRDKVTYLTELRTSTQRLQDDINDFLTRKMEEDKRAGTIGDTGVKEDEKKMKREGMGEAGKSKEEDLEELEEEEEENYGE